MKIHFTWLTASLFLFTVSFAQKTQPVNSGEIISNGLKLHEQGKYKEAVEEYKQVTRNDTNYVYALYEKAYSQSADENIAGAIKTCREGLQADNGFYEHDFFLLLASNFDDEGDGEHAIKVYDSALVKYPNSQGLFLNKGIAYIRLKKIDEAEVIFKDLLIKNPYYSSAHFRLAQCALQKGQMVPAMMCLYTYLINTPAGTQSKNIIKLLDNLSKGTDDVMLAVNKRQENPSGNFAVVEQIVLSKIALDKGYKVLTDLDDPIIRQLQVMMEKLEYDNEDPDFYMQFYVPYLKDIFTKKLFEPAVFRALSDVKLDAIQRYVKKNSKEIDRAIDIINENFTAISSTRELNIAKRKTLEPIYHFEDGILFAKGSLIKEKLLGKWEFYHKNGNIKSIGQYDNNGKKTGKWIYYYENGKLSGSDIWKDGLQDGEDLIYNKQGVLTAKSNFKNGKLDGSKYSYFSIGHLYFISTYKEGLESGKYIEYYTDGRKKIEAATADDKLNGNYASYHENGKLHISAFYQKGKLSGNYKSYYDNGQLEFEANYTNGEINGEVKTFHTNSKILRKANYVNGLTEGDEIEYNDEGIMTEKVIYKKGKADGLAEYFDDDGKLFSTFFFDNDKLKLAKYFDKSGREISSSSRQSKEIDLTMYNSEGFKTRTVTYNDKAEKQDKEIFYYNSGQVKETNSYKNGLLQGVSTGYYFNGSKQYEVSYEEGEKNGFVKNYYLNGKISSEAWYVKGEANGNWIEYNEKGTITAVTAYLNDDVYGTKQSFEANGKLDDEEVYNSGWLTAIYQYDTAGNKIHTMQLQNGSGKYDGIYFNGKTKYEGNYVNGQPHGAFKNYFFDGSLQVSKTYDNGELNGEYVDYYYGGKISSQGKYVSGEKTGIWIYFFSDGKMSREENYKDGQLDGKMIYYFTNGKPEREFIYKNGNRNGAYKRYSEDGQLCCVLNYKDDVVVSYSYNDKSSHLVPAIAIAGGNGKVKAFYSNGNVSAEMEYIDGKLNGAFKVYYPDGKIYYEEENLVNGITNGKLFEYYANGKKQSEYNYYYDNADGAYTEYYDNGKVKEEGFFYNGLLTGSRKYYNATGKLTEKREYYFGTLLNVTK